MSKDKNKMSYDAGTARSSEAEQGLRELEPLGVTRAEIAAADKLLASVADEMDADVDYSGMLRRIKAEAMAQGYAAAAAKKTEDNTGRSKQRVKRILSIAASLAAAFVLGFGIMGVIRSVDSDVKTGDIAASSTQNAPSNDAAVTPEATTVPAATAAAETPKPTEAVRSPLATNEPVAPSEYANSDVDITPLPSEFPVRGGVRGYTYIKGFEDPESSEGLIPPAMPEFLAVELAEDGLGYTASGKDVDGIARYVTCKVLEAGEYDLPEGVALYTLHDDGRIGYIWRINEGSVMYIDFEGFEYPDAEILLLSYTIPDIAD